MSQEPPRAPWWATLPPLLVGVVLLVSAAVSLATRSTQSDNPTTLGEGLATAGFICIGAWLVLEARRRS